MITSVAPPGSGNASALASQILSLVKSVPIEVFYLGKASFVGGNVSSWTDLSGNGFNAVQAGPTAQPAWNTNDPQLNCMPSLTWDGVNDELHYPLTVPDPSVTPRCYIGVLRTNTWTSANTFFSANGGAVQIMLQVTASPQAKTYNGVYGNPVNMTLGAAKFFLASFTGSAADQLTIGANTSTANTSTATSAGPCYIGSYGGGGFAPMKMGIFLVTRGVPTEIATLKKLLALPQYYGASILT